MGRDRSRASAHRRRSQEYSPHGEQKDTVVGHQLPPRRLPRRGRSSPKGAGDASSADPGAGRAPPSCISSPRDRPSLPVSKSNPILTRISAADRPGISEPGGVQIVALRRSAGMEEDRYQNSADARAL